MVENIDILKTIGHHAHRPKTVIGFAAESENLIANAKSKLETKNCDLILANSIENGAVFGLNHNQITLLYKNGKTENWPQMTKQEIAKKLLMKIIEMKV